MFGLTLKDLNATLIDPTLKLLFGNSLRSVSGVVASTTQTQAAGVPIVAAYTRVATVAVAGDALTLPPATVGDSRVVVNAAAANAMNVFPALGEFINALTVNTALSVAANKTVLFFCLTPGVWNTVVTA